MSLIDISIEFYKFVTLHKCYLILQSVSDKIYPCITMHKDENHSFHNGAKNWLSLDFQFMKIDLQRNRVFMIYF